MISENNVAEQVANNRIAELDEQIADTKEKIVKTNEEVKQLNKQLENAKPELLYSKQEAMLLTQLLHLAVVHPEKGGLAPVAGQGTPTVSELVTVFSKRIAAVAQSLPEQTPQQG